MKVEGKEQKEREKMPFLKERWRVEIEKRKEWRKHGKELKR